MKRRKGALLFITGMLVGTLVAGSVVFGTAAGPQVQRSAQKIYVDGELVAMEAYNIDGSNYIKLRDTGKAVDFNVYWDGTVQIQKNNPYTGEAPAGKKPENQVKPTPEAQITEAQAKAKALAHAGLTESEVVFTKVKLDMDDGRLEYEIEFYKGNKEYDYDIDATTGEIRSYDVDIRDDKGKTPGGTVDKPVQPVQPVQPQAPTDAVTEDIGAEQAVSIALQHAGLTRDQVTALRVEKDREGSRWIYEVEFKKGMMEYSYDIDLATGKILDYEWDND